MAMNRSPRPAPVEEPITPELLADLQAGLLDDATATWVRQRIRDDPKAADMLAALDRVRRELAELGPDTAPPVPPEVSDRLVAALRTADSPSRARHWRRAGAVVGACAALLAVGVGVVMLQRPDAPAEAPVAQFGHITAITAKPRPDIGLTDSQLLAVLAASPDYGPLADPVRRTGCLAALGYPAGVRVLGARPHHVAGRDGVLIVLTDDRPDTVVGLVVPADCDPDGAPEPIARTVVRQPAVRPAVHP